MRYEVLVFQHCPSRTTRLDAAGRGYVSAAAARPAARRRGLVPAETRQIRSRLPACDDARGWDAYRLARGYAGCHH
jgi:hypothetical protein